MPRKSKTTNKKTRSEVKHTNVPPQAKAAATTKKGKKPAVAPIFVAVAPNAMNELNSASAERRADAATAMGKSNDLTAVEPLLAALRDLDADVARDAATALGRLGGTSAVEPLIEVITNANGYFHSVVRSAAAASLGQLNDQRAVPALLNAVNDPIAEPSSEAIRALANLRDERAVSALIEVVRNRNGFFVNSVRRAAVLGLIKLGGEDARQELRSVASNAWEDSVIREEAAATINVA